MEDIIVLTYYNIVEIEDADYCLAQHDPRYLNLGITANKMYKLNEDKSSGSVVIFDDFRREAEPFNFS